MLNKQEVQHIAKLARLSLSEKEIKKFKKDLTKVLDYFEKLNEVDVANIKPTGHLFELRNVTREDIAKLNIKNQR